MGPEETVGGEEVLEPPQQPLAPSPPPPPPPPSLRPTAAEMTALHHGASRYTFAPSGGGTSLMMAPVGPPAISSALAPGGGDGILSAGDTGGGWSVEAPLPPTATPAPPLPLQ